MRREEPANPAYMQRVEDEKDARSERLPKGREHIGQKRNTQCYGCRKELKATTGRYGFYCEECQNK